MSRFDRNIARVTSLITALVIMAVLCLLWRIIKLIFKIFRFSTIWYLDQFQFRPLLSRTVAFLALLAFYGIFISLAWDLVSWRTHYIPPDVAVTENRDVWFIAGEAAPVYSKPSTKAKAEFDFQAGSKLKIDSTYQNPEWLRILHYSGYYVKRAACTLKTIPVTMYLPNGDFGLPLWSIFLLISLPLLVCAILIRTKEDLVESKLNSYKPIECEATKYRFATKLNPKIKIEIS